MRGQARHALGYAKRCNAEPPQHPAERRHSPQGANPAIAEVMAGLLPPTGKTKGG